MKKYNGKTWNPTVFQKYTKKVENVKLNKLVKSGILQEDRKLAARLKDGVGGNYIVEPIKGILEGDVQNYDGQTDFVYDSRDTYYQGKVVIGRMKAWSEDDFQNEVTGQTWEVEAGEVAEYYQGIDQDDILAILNGIFAMKDSVGIDFIQKHSEDLTKKTGKTVSPTTLNNSIQKACGDRKQSIAVVYCHSQIATNLENISVVEYIKYTDKDGFTRDLGLATWGGKIIIIDDSLPISTSVETAGVYTLKIDTAGVVGDKINIFGTEYEFVANDATVSGNQIKIGSSGTVSQQATNIKTMLESKKKGIEADYSYAVTSDTITITLKSTVKELVIEPYCEPSETSTIEITLSTTTEAAYATDYTSYALGSKFFKYSNCGAKIPSEVDRNPEKQGGIDLLYTRQRKMFVPKYISFTKKVMESESPTNEELADGENWEIVNNGNGLYVNHKLIPLVRIISRG